MWTYDPIVLLFLPIDYLSEVDRTEKAEQEEKDAEKLFLTGKPEDVGIVEIIERVRKPEQLPVFYSGGFRVLKSLIITSEYWQGCGNTMLDLFDWYIIIQDKLKISIYLSLDKYK